MVAERLIARIRGQLELGTPDLEARSLAGEYAALCARARERLEQCATLIRSGNDHAAFQVAESEPDLLGLCAQLSFAESDRWNALCRERGLPAGFPLDAQHVLALEGLYGKEIGESHPLYRDYRDAIRSRDEDRALSVLRSIVRINPDDPNARSELTRLSAKFLRESLGKVAELFARRDEEGAVALMNRMERFGASELAGDARWDAALALRVAWLRAKASEQISRLVAEATEARAGGHWEACASAIGRARSLERDHQISLTPELAGPLSELESWAGELAAAAEAEATVRAATQSLIDEWESLRLDGERRSSPAILISRLGAWLERASAFEERLPDGLIREVRGLRQITRARLSRRYAVMTTSWVTGLLLVLIGTYWWHQEQQARTEAFDRFAEAESFLSAGEHDKAALSLDEFRRKNPSLAEDPALRTQETSLRQRIAEGRELEQSLRADALYLEARRKEGVTLANLGATHQRAKDYEASLGKAGDAVRARLSKILAEPAALITACARVIEQARTDLAQQRAQLRKLTEDGSAVTDVPAAVQSLDRLRSLIASLKAAGLRDLDEAEAEADRASVRLEGERKSLDAFRTLADAAELKSYLAALATTAPAAGEKSDLGRRAAFILERADNLRGLPRSALAPRVGAMWDASATADSLGIFRPDALPEGEAEILRKLSDDSVTRALRRYSVQLTSSQGSRILRPAFVVGEPIETVTPLNGGKEVIVRAREVTREGPLTDTTWSRRVFDNGVKSGEELQEGPAIPELEYFRTFGRLIEPRSNRANEPLLRSLDRIRRSASPYVEIRAYQLQELFRLASLRPDAHGLLFSPSAQRDADQLRRITQNSMGPHDFLFREKWADAQVELKALFVRQTGPTYAEEARFWRAVFASLRGRSLIFAGTVSREGKPALREKLAGVALYGLDIDGKPAVLFRVGADGVAQRVAEAAPLTPLLRFAGSVTEAAQAAGVPAGLLPPEGGWEMLLQGRDL